MRLRALILRILQQILRDKRTMVLILIAPILILALVNFILKAEDTSYNIGVVNAEEAFVEELADNEEYDITVTEVEEVDLEQLVFDGDLNGGIIFREDKPVVYVSGVDETVASKVEMFIKSAEAAVRKSELEDKLEEMKEASHGKMDITYEEPEFVVTYVAGEADSTLFDKFGTQLIGIILFFFVFLIAGINFLGERTSGTLEKLLSTPIRRWEVVLGYLIGYSGIAVLQSLFLIIFSVYVLGLRGAGSFGLVILITLITSINALSFGILLSTLANSEFQMMQFIPIVILPQIFLCGLFRVSGVWSNLSYIMPLNYTSHALMEVMVKGNGMKAVWMDLALLVCMSILIVFANVKLLKKQRSI